MRITKLDGLRGIFSIMVVIYHYPQEFIPHFIHNFFIVAKSHLFVDFFFVLSGFVIAYNYNNRIRTGVALGEFIQKRFIRLYPLLLYTTFVFLFVVLGVKIFLPQFAKNSHSFLPAMIDTFSTLSFLNSTPIFADNFGGNKYGMNYPSWSISAEMFAYLFFGVVSLWAVKKKKNTVLISSIFIGMFFLLIKTVMKIEGNFDFVRGIISFNIGYVVYLYSRRRIGIRNGWEAALLSLFFGFLYFSSVIEGEIFIMLVDGCLIPLFFGLFIFVLLRTNGMVSKLMETRLFQFLGKISYSVYLNHAILVYIFPKAIFSVLQLQPSITMQIDTLILSLFVTILYSYFTYTVIELKGGRLVKELLSKRSPAPSAIPVKGASEERDQRFKRGKSKD